MKGKLIVIDGLDGSGKATQTQLLSERLSAAGKDVQRVSFPNYQSRSSALVQMYLSGEFGTQPGDVNAYAASAFYAVDRYASWRTTSWGAAYKEGALVLADRYTTSNAIHQCAKLPKDQWEAYLTWLEDFEHGKLGIPKPDLVVYLDVEPALSQELLAQRYASQGQKDIHEQDVEYIKVCREAAHWCAQKLGWKLLVCNQNVSMRQRSDITTELEQLIPKEWL